MPIRAILFDLGGTLLDYGGRPWPEVERASLAALAAHLHDLGYAVPDGYVDEGLRRMSRVWAEVTAGTAHVTMPVLFERYLADGLLAIEPAHHERCAECLIAATQRGTTLVPGAPEVLAALRERGVRIGLVSNTMWPGEHHRRDLRAFGLLDAFEVMLFSSEHGRWKPDPAIFRDALRALGVPGDEAAFVGDRYDADVVGAERAGMTAVLYRNPLSTVPPPPYPRTIERLPDLLPLLGV